MNAGKWGEVIRVCVDPQDNVWVFHRCFAAVLGDPRTLPGHSDGYLADCDMGGSHDSVFQILKFDRSGTFLAGNGQAMFVRPHGFYVDRDDNVCATDGLENGERGYHVITFSPDGKVLLTFGTKEVAGNGPDTLDDPSDVVTAPNGDIFVADGKRLYGVAGSNNRIAKFTKGGKFIKAWGKLGKGPGEFDLPRPTISLDSLLRAGE